MPTGFEDFFVTDPEIAMTPSPITGLPAGLDPIWGGIANRLFGGDESRDKRPRWVQKPDGSWTYARGGYTDVPASDIPFTGAPTGDYQIAAEQVRILNDLLPHYARSIAGQIIPQEQAKVAAAQVTSPQMAELMKNLYAKYGPQLNEIGNQIARTNALASAERDRDVLAGPGQDLVRKALETAKLYDPEFFATREATSGRIGDLLKSIDLEGGLSETERREIEQGLSREGEARGTASAPSQTETVSNAMRYGEAGRKRKLENQSALAGAIQTASAFLPASRSGVDVFQVATGKPSGANTGESKFTGINAPGSEAYQLAGGLFGNIGQTSNISQQNKGQLDAIAASKEKDWLDQFTQFTSGLGNLGSLAGGMAMCWVARQVYGINNPKWIKFRNWLIFEGPNWLVVLYLRYGERFAKFISNKSTLKWIIKKLMDTKTK